MIGVHLGYLLVLKRLARKNLVIEYGDDIKNVANISEISAELPLVSVIIPVYNEESVIKRRIENIYESSYPKGKMEVIVVDSGSTDKTSAIIKDNFSDTVILLSEEIRSGKAHAINLGLRNCKGEIVIITDGPTLFEKDTIFHLVNSLKSSSVGGVSALYKIPNANENQITASEQAFWSYKDRIRLLESLAYSTSWLSGEACAFRKKILTNLEEDTLADDSNAALHIISKGYKVVVNGKSYFSEKSPAEFEEYFRIKSRRVLGGLIETLRFRFFLFNRKYGPFGTIIFPYRFFTQFVNPILSYATMALSIIAAIEISKDFDIYGIALIAILLLMIGLVFRNKIVAYIYLQIISSIALVMLLTKRNQVLWTQSKTTRI
jgi:cellulose synthase/poly-beta-1,6-N-acetylglucosamine synthase-like glycosyltransferase